MDAPGPRFPQQTTNAGSGLDPRLQATPDYGTLGPGSDLGNSRSPSAHQANPLGAAQVIAAAIGIMAALFVGVARRGHPGWSGLPASSPIERKQSSATKEPGSIDGLQPQKQAEALLELAVRHSDGAVEQITSRVDQWHGEVKWSPQIATLTTAALNSDDMRVRQSGVEVELAAYGLAKNPASFQYVARMTESADHSQKIWALWALGLLANRGVETERAVETLTGHLADQDVDSRRWAVEGLALTGSDSTIQPLLKTMHGDRSPAVRERAACSLAESGLFTSEQRMSAVPQLLNYTDDPSLDAQTHAWAFQALSDITHARLPKDPAAWRNWYESRSTNGQ
jgi:hypothetical protein